MTIQEVYERYKHLEPVLCNEKWLGDNDGLFLRRIAHDLWQAIKAEATKD